MPGWFYMSDGRRNGPVDEDELVRALCAFESPRGVLIWSEGLPEWTAAGALPGIGSRLPPPLGSRSGPRTDETRSVEPTPQPPSLEQSPKQAPIFGAPGSPGTHKRNINPLVIFGIGVILCL